MPWLAIDCRYPKGEILVNILSTIQRLFEEKYISVNFFRVTPILLNVVTFGHKFLLVTVATATSEAAAAAIEVKADEICLNIFWHSRTDGRMSLLKMIKFDTIFLVKHSNSWFQNYYFSSLLHFASSHEGTFCSSWSSSWCIFNHHYRQILHKNIDNNIYYVNFEL